jgi:hypothetical protein
MPYIGPIGEKFKKAIGSLLEGTFLSDLKAMPMVKRLRLRSPTSGDRSFVGA